MNETFRIELLGFTAASRESAVTALVNAFGVGEDVAAGFVDSAPVSVRSGVEGATAKEYAHQLLAIGADVRIVSEITGQSADYKAAEVQSAKASTTPAPSPFQKKPAAATPPAATPPAAPVPRATPRPSPPADPAAAADAKTTFCPACGFRQAPSEQCEHCGYKFPSAIAEDTQQAGTGEDDLDDDAVDDDLDVFENLRSTDSAGVDETDKPARKKSKKAKKAKALSEQAKRAQKIAAQSGRYKFLKGPRRVMLYVSLGILVIATVLFVVFGPSEQTEGDPVPPDAIPAPPGFQYRAE